MKNRFRSIPFPLPIGAALLMGGIATATWGQGPARLDRPAYTSAQQVVVLRNGNVLYAQVEPLANAYRVITASSEIILPNSEVERVTPSLQVAYEQKRAEQSPPTAADHLRLASWCLRQEMWPQAAREINDARTSNPRHPALQLLERRLQMASRADMRKTATERESSQPASPPPKATWGDQHMVTAMNHDALAAEMQQLETLAASLPEGTVETFTRQIQPLLVHGCAAVGCHSQQEERPFRLHRDLLHDMSNRHTTLSNLAATWEMIDQQQSDHSPLLTQPAGPHGGLPQAVFTGHRRELHDRLTQWVHHATRRDQTADKQASPSLPTAAPLNKQAKNAWANDFPTPQPSATARASVIGETESSAASETDKLNQPVVEGISEADADFLPPPPRIQRGVTPQRFVPRDEFDPEIFNRLQADRLRQFPSTMPQE